MNRYLRSGAARHFTTITKLALALSLFSAMGPKKYYAVRNGRGGTGIYYNWADCKDSVNGYSKAEFKSFATQAEANAYLNGNSTTASSTDGGSYYAGYSSASSGPPRSAGRSRSSHSRVNNSSWRRPYARSRQYSTSHNGSDLPASGAPASSRANTFRHCHDLQWKEFNHSDFSHAPPDVERVFTDGSSLGNGNVGSKAGYGVYWGPNDSRNIGAPVQGEQTNNHGELLAINHALNDIKNGSSDLSNKKYEVYSDSQYACKAITEYSRIWAKNGWKTSNSQPVKHQKLIQSINESVNEILDRGANLDIKYIPAHVGHEGNEMADRYAKLGAKQH